MYKRQALDTPTAPRATGGATLGMVATAACAALVNAARDVPGLAISRPTAAARTFSSLVSLNAIYLDGLCS